MCHSEELCLKREPLEEFHRKGVTGPIKSLQTVDGWEGSELVAGTDKASLVAQW